MKKTVIKLIVILLISLILSFIPYSKDTSVIDISFLLTFGSELFGVSLAVLALLFTIIDRYKEKVELNIQNDIQERSLPVLKNIGDDVMVLLIIVIALFVIDVFSLPLEAVQKFKVFSQIDLERTILLGTLAFLIVTTLDITCVIVKLIKGLIYIPKQNDNKIFELSLEERNLVLATRKLDRKHISELLEYIKTLIVKQEINK